jgi:hypothetical protein
MVSLIPVDPLWNQAALEKRMSEWCLNNWKAMPSEERVRHYCKEVLTRFREGYKG